MIEMCAGDPIEFPPSVDSGPDTRNSLPCQFSGPVDEACCVLTGIDYGYTKKDHHVFRTTILLEPVIVGDIVTVRATYGFRDSSGFFDDQYDARIFFCVIADVQERGQDFVSLAPRQGAKVFQSRQAAKLPCEVLPPSDSPPPP